MKLGKKYYIPAPSSVNMVKVDLWIGNEHDRQLLDYGMAFSTVEEARFAAELMKQVALRIKCQKEAFLIRYDVNGNIITWDNQAKFEANYIDAKV